MKNILVVEDESTMRKGLVQTLEEDGHRVAEAASAEQGLKIFNDNAIDIIVTDLLMPGMSGL